MAKTTNLTKAILVAMGATATAAAGASTLEAGSLLELPAVDTAEYALAAGDSMDDALTTTAKKKKAKKKKKRTECTTRGGNQIFIPYHPKFKGCPPGFYKKKKA